MSRGLLRRVVDGAVEAGSSLVVWMREPDRPLLGIELHATAVGALRLTRQGGRRRLAAAATLGLPEGALVPSMARGNVIDPEALRVGVRQAIERVGGLTERRVALALPDGIARIVVLNDIDLGSARGAALEDVIRFRLKDKVPFDIRQAVVAWDVVRSSQPGTPGAVIAVATQRSVLDEYERIATSLGLIPGLVEIGGVALLRAVAATNAVGDWLTLNWNEDYFSVFLSRFGVPLLARTVTGSTSAADVARELSHTILYHRERLGGLALAGARVRSGHVPTAEALETVGQAVGLVPTVIDPLSGLGAAASEELGQAVAGVACALVAGAA